MPWWDDGTPEVTWPSKPVVQPPAAVVQPVPPVSTVLPPPANPVAPPVAPPVSTVKPPPAQSGPWWDQGSSTVAPVISPVTPTPQVSTVNPPPWTPPEPTPAPPPAPVSPPVAATPAPAAAPYTVDSTNSSILHQDGRPSNYVFEYADGTRGNQPYRRGPDGQVLLNAQGGILDEGKYLGMAREDGTISPQTIGNVKGDGNVDTYGGYTSPQDVYYPNGNGPRAGFGQDTIDPNNAAYQSGTQVTPSNPTPTQQPGPGGAAFGGTAPSGAGSGGGSGPGGSGSSSSGGSTTTTTGGQTDREVDAATETIEGRINGLMAQDAQGNYTNPVIQQAANRALMSMQGRGLLNSSMGIEAASQAAIAKAIEIAGPDAQTYFSQGRANQDVKNVFERDERGYRQDNYKLDRQNAHDMAKLDKELENRLTVVGLEGKSRDEAAAIGRQHAVDMANSEAASRNYELTIRRISDIDNNTTLDEEAKAKLKSSAWKDFEYFMRSRNLVYESGTGDRYTTKPKDSGSGSGSGSGGGSGSNSGNSGGGSGNSGPWWDQ